MIRFIRQSSLASVAIGLLWGGFLLFGGRLATDTSETVLKPWFALCACITPNQWQIQGNSLLGMLWLFSGVVIVSILAGAAAMTAWQLVRRVVFSHEEVPQA
jgi:hypothetical protein